MENLRVSAGLSGAGAKRGPRFNVSSVQTVCVFVNEMMMMKKIITAVTKKNPVQ